MNDENKIKVSKIMNNPKMVMVTSSFLAENMKEFKEEFLIKNQRLWYDFLDDKIIKWYEEKFEVK